MDENEYLVFARDELIKREISKINDLSTSDLLNRMLYCPDCGEKVVTLNQLSRAVIEGVRPEEVEKMLCIRDHCHVTSSSVYFDDRVDVDVNDLGVDLKEDSHLDNEEDDIASKFRAAITRLCERKNVAFSISYAYSDDDKKMNDENKRGRTFQFGSSPIVNDLITQMKKDADNNTDDGIVFNMG